MKRILSIACACLMSMASASSSNPTLNWNPVNPGPSGGFGSFTCFAYGGGTYVAAGTDSIIYSSSDGSHWTARSPLGNSASYYDAIYGSGRFVLIGYDSSRAWHASVSSDGAAWSDVLLPTSTSSDLLQNSPQSIGYGNGVFMVVGGPAFTSTDGLTWQQHDIDSSGTYFFSSVAYAKGTFAAQGINRRTGDPVVYYSTDGGNSWSAATASFPRGFDTEFNGIVSNGAGFIVSGTYQQGFETQGPSGPIYWITYTSPDGKIWSPQATPAGSGSSSFHQLIWDGAHYLTQVSTSSGTQISVYSSPDGTSWTQGPALTTAIPTDPTAVSPGHYVGGDWKTVLTSTDFATWTATPVFSGPTGPTSTLLWSGYVNGKYFATGLGATVSTTNSILESDDGLSWSQVFNEAGSGTGAVSAVTYGNGLFLAMDSQGSVLSSSDGLHWAIAATAPADPMAAVIYGAGLFVAYDPICSSSCPAARIYTSPDAVTWTLQDLSALAPVTVQGVAFNGTRFVALSPTFQGVVPTATDKDYILTTTDGVTWTQEATSLPAGVSFNPFVYANGELMTTYRYDQIPAPSSSGFSAYVYTSSDGLNWTGGFVGNSFNGGNTAPITFDGTSFYGNYGNDSVGDNGAFATSSDGLNWTPVTGQDAGLGGLDINAANGRLYDVGNAGEILVAEPGGPAAAASSVNTAENQAVSGSLAITGSTSGTLAYSVGFVPAHGKVTIDNTATGAFTYTPAAGYSGADSFTFAVSDGVVQTAATESVTVTATTSPGGGSSSGGGGTSSGGGSSSGGGGGFDWLVLGLLFGIAAPAGRLRRRKH